MYKAVKAVIMLDIYVLESTNTKYTIKHKLNATIHLYFTRLDDDNWKLAAAGSSQTDFLYSIPYPHSAANSLFSCSRRIDELHTTNIMEFKSFKHSGGQLLG